MPEVKFSEQPTGDIGPQKFLGGYDPNLPDADANERFSHKLFDRDYVDASQMMPHQTNGAMFDSHFHGSGAVGEDRYLFDSAVEEFVQFKTVAPASWEQEVDVQFSWCSDSLSTGNVKWVIKAKVVGDGEDIEGAGFGAEASVVDTFQGEDKLSISPSVTLTITGSVAEGNMIYYEVSRDPTGDSLPDDAGLAGVYIKP